LQDQPIRARPPSPVGRAWQWARRHRQGVAVAMLAAAVLAVAGVGALLRPEGSARQTSGSVEPPRLAEATALDKAPGMQSARQTGYRVRVWDLLRQTPPPPGEVAELRHVAARCLGDWIGVQPAIFDFTEEVRSVALHPHGTLLTTGLADGAVSLRDLPS